MYIVKSLELPNRNNAEAPLTRDIVIKINNNDLRDIKGYLSGYTAAVLEIASQYKSRHNISYEELLRFLEQQPTR